MKIMTNQEIIVSAVYIVLLMVSIVLAANIISIGIYLIKR